MAGFVAVEANRVISRELTDTFFPSNGCVTLGSGLAGVDSRDLELPSERGACVGVHQEAGSSAESFPSI